MGAPLGNRNAAGKHSGKIGKMKNGKRTGRRSNTMQRRLEEKARANMRKNMTTEQKKRLKSWF